MLKRIKVWVVLTLISVSLLLQGCSTLPTPIISSNPPVVSAILLEPCEQLVPPEDGSFPSIAGKLVETVGQYKDCARRQKAATKAIKDMQKYIAN
jgi:starvation-inducible outer membrane lipoprotein